MSLTRVVNGQRAEMSPDEVAEFEASRHIGPEEALEQERAQMAATRYQAKAALHQAGLLVQVEALMESADPLNRFEWEEKPRFTRTSPTLNWAASQLDLTDTEVDDLFRAAMSIED